MNFKKLLTTILLLLIVGVSQKLNAQTGTLTSPVNITSGWYFIKWVDLNGDTYTDYTDSDVNGKYIRNYATEVTVVDKKYSLYLTDEPTTLGNKALSLVYFEKDGSESGRGVDGYLRGANGHCITQTGVASSSKINKNYIIYRSYGTPDYSVITSGYTGTRYSLIPRGKDATPYLGQSAQNFFPVAQFYAIDLSNDLGLQAWAVSIDGEEDAQVTYNGSSGYGLTSVYNGGTFFLASGVTPSTSDFSAPNRWGFSPDIEVDATNHTIKVTYIDIHKVYTINNTNTNRGALIYNPDASTKYVWSSGKSGTFDASNANSQWVIYPTETSGQFYLYNVGAGKFAIPTAIAQGSGNPWIFSDNAVAVIFESQNDGTQKIKMASNPVSGTNAAYMAVSNDYTGPIINYNDVGGNFTITLVDGQDQSTAANAAVNKLVKNAYTALTTYPQTSGWYAIQIKSKTGSDSYAGRYLQNSTTLYNDLYPLTFTGGVDVQPAITDPTFITYINHTSWDVNTWQMPDGRYLVSNSSSKFPTPSATAGNVICGYDNGNYFKSSANYYADPYNSSANYFIGETTYMRTAWNVYPIDLSDAGLVDWKVLITSDGTTPVYDKEISCTRNDVAGLTSVYTGGHFFLPTGVTPTSSDFSMSGALSIDIDNDKYTITATFDPNLAILESDVTVAQGWQTAGRSSDVYLLRVTANPFQDATNASLTVSLKDGTEQHISSLTLYEADSSSPEVLSTGSGAPTLTQVSTTSIDGSSTTATLSIGSLSAGTHYYWLKAHVSSNAMLGTILDAAVTGISYQVAGQTAQDLDLTSVGDPADRGAMVFNKHSYPFLPRDNGSRVYRIPAMIVADDGSIIVACDKRYDSYTDIGNGHVIDIVVRRSTDGGATWGDPVVIAKGDNSNDATCGYGDPSLYKDKDGTLYCIYGAGNTGYFYGLSRVCVSKSTDNGATWNTTNTSPTDLTAQEKLTDHASSYGSNTCYGLYDYFVTSGRGLCTSEGYLMGLLPAQPYTDSGKTAHTSNSQDYIFYSTDKGETWHISENAIFTGGDEAKIIQANDGSLIASVRQGYNRGFNTATYSDNGDGTLSFTMGTQYNNSQLNAGGYANNQDIFYYQRKTKTGKTDVIFHSMTTGQHANFKLYYSTDGGENWTEFLTVQTKGTRYVTMEKSGTDDMPGSLYLFFEDQSLNSAGGYTDYNHYPLNFIEITREQLESLIPTLNTVITNGVKVVYGTTAHTTYGTLSGLTWTSKVTSGVSTGDNDIAGLTMVASDGAFNQFSSWNSHYNIAYQPATANTDATLTLTAPAGYLIDSYSMLVAKASSASHTYTVTNAAGTSTEVPFGSSASSYATVSQSDINANSTVITVNTSDVSKWLAIADFVVTLKPVTTVYRIKNNNGKYMKENVTNCSVDASELVTSNYAQLWTLDFSDNDVTIKNALTDRYIQNQTNTSWQFSTGVSPTVFTSALNDGKYTFKNSNNGWWDGGLHCDASSNVVFWDISADNSKWTIEPVTISYEELDAARSAIKEASSGDLTTFFTSTACTSLRATYASYTDEELRTAMSTLPTAVQDMAVKVKNDSWTNYDGWDKTERSFRVADYNAYSSHTRWSGIIGTGYSLGRLTNPTGISVSAGDIIQVYVGDIPSGQSVQLEVAGQYQSSGNTYALKQGMNALLMTSSGNCFVRYEVDNTTDGGTPYTALSSYAPVTVHIEGGTVNGYFDLTKGDDNLDWAIMQFYLLKGTSVDIKTDKLLFHMTTDLVKSACPENMVELLGEWDKILGMEHSLMGLEEFDGYWNNLLSVTDVTSSYMYATTYGTYYETSTISSVMSYEDMLAGGATWGPAHENGHIFQKYINMVGQTEVSNNLFSNVAVYNNGHLTSRASLISTTLQNMADNVYWNDRGIWERTHMYFQLYQFFHILGNKSDFYPELFKALRSDPMVHTGNIFIPATDDYLKFYKKCCQVSGYDLTEFFQAYGFFVIPELTSYTLDSGTKNAYKIGDYGDYYLTVTQAEIDAAKAEVAAMNLPKCNIIFIEDRITAPDATYEGAAAGTKKVAFDANEFPIGNAGETGQYTDFDKICSDYSYNVSERGNVTMEGTGAVGFKVYDSSGNLRGLYNTYNFTLPDGIGTGYTIKAAAGDGTSAAATYDSSIEVNEFPKSNTNYVLYTPFRGGRFVMSNGADEGLVGTNTDAPADAMKWQFVARDGESETFDIKNVDDNSYIDPTASNDTQLSTTSSKPATGWKIKSAATKGMYIVYTTAGAQLNQTNNSGTGGYKIYNWGGGSNTTDDGCQYMIQEVTDLSTSVIGELSGFSMSTSETPADNLSAGKWYVMFDRGANHGYLYENGSNKLYNTTTAPSNGTITGANAKYLVRLVESGRSGKYYLQTGLGNYFYQFEGSTNVPTTAYTSQPITVDKIASTDGHFYLQSSNNSVILDANACNYYDNTVVGWGTSVPTSTGGNNDWAFYPVTLTKSVALNVVGDASYATLYLDYDVQTDENTKAYYIPEASDGSVTLTEVENEGHDIPALTAVVLVNKEKSTSATLTVTSGLSSIVSTESNLLKGTLTSMTLDLSQGSSYYSLGSKSGVIGFYKYSSNITLGANKAYLDVSSASTARGFVFDFDGNPTGIETMDDGQGTMFDGQGKVYDLSGRRVDSQLKHGIYIVNGKKVIK